LNKRLNGASFQGLAHPHLVTFLCRNMQTLISLIMESLNLSSFKSYNRGLDLAISSKP